ncbi:uncharacterized protein APUU_21028S [Aspergillus puulaauensis]|uniref:Uncharacterized protein n=1 Tax=Aspergillus puulaauensis TaxID=1220207 RepID=A0A7R7XFR8_9EURO|nr:uncharacterized protein APUU_21028S [Aspergillus puulaauensis]BCS20596.1 hypothetical protein APUU_21028S [Aspergillus puulaauensis]
MISVVRVSTPQVKNFISPKVPTQGVPCNTGPVTPPFSGDSQLISDGLFIVEGGLERRFEHADGATPSKWQKKKSRIYDPYGECRRKANFEIPLNSRVTTKEGPN